jgi:hypothetical protein
MMVFYILSMITNVNILDGSTITTSIPGVSCSLLSIDIGLRWESVLLLGLDGVELCSSVDGVFQ